MSLTGVPFSRTVAKHACKMLLERSRIEDDAIIQEEYHRERKKSEDAKKSKRAVFQVSNS